MTEKTQKELTKEWVMTMLYGSGQNINQLIENGCRVMVFGIEFEDFMKILEDLEVDGHINKLPTNTGNPCTLTTKGIFYIKKHTLLPLIRLAEDPSLLETFVNENKTRCNTAFLEELSNEPDEDRKISSIKVFAQQHYLDIAKIIFHLGSYLKLN